MRVIQKMDKLTGHPTDFMNCPKCHATGEIKYFVYIVVCSDFTLYTGYTTDLEKRVATHNKGKGAKYTRSRLPVSLVYDEEFDTKSEAMKREYQIKQLSRQEKIDVAYGKTILEN